MSSSYTGWRARSYDRWWGTYTARTVAATLKMIDLELLLQAPERLRRAPRVLDVGCGTGVLLRRLLEVLPTLEAEGIDASADMLQQVGETLRAWPQVHLFQAAVEPGPQAGLPYAPGTFDLITCTNMLHYLAAPISTLAGLRQMLAPERQLVLGCLLWSHASLRRSGWRWEKLVLSGCGKTTPAPLPGQWKPLGTY